MGGEEHIQVKEVPVKESNQTEERQQVHTYTQYELTLWCNLVKDSLIKKGHKKGCQIGREG